MVVRIDALTWVKPGAGDGNRTRMTSLEGSHPTPSGIMLTSLTLQSLCALLLVIQVGEILGDASAAVAGIAARCIPLRPAYSGGLLSSKSSR
jgi:hypothetical protein